MICPNVEHAPHHYRGALSPGFLPLGTMCETTDGCFTCFDCQTKIPGGKYAVRPTTEETPVSTTDTAPNYRALFTPCIFVSSDGTVDVDFGESLQNVVDRDDADHLYDDLSDLPTGAQVIVDEVDRLIAEHGVSGFLRRLADELDGVGDDGGWVVTPGTESDQEIDLGGGWWAEAGPDEDRWSWSVWDQWTRAEGSYPLATGFSHTEEGAKRDALATYAGLRR